MGLSTNGKPTTPWQESDALAALAIIGWYFIRNYDEEIYDSSMADLVEEYYKIVEGK